VAKVATVTKTIVTVATAVRAVTQAKRAPADSAAWWEPVEAVGTMGLQAVAGYRSPVRLVTVVRVVRVGAILM
jgi:hypothetical protein